MESNILGNDDKEKMYILDKDAKINSMAHGVCFFFNSPVVEKPDNVKASIDGEVDKVPAWIAVTSLGSLMFRHNNA